MSPGVGALWLVLGAEGGIRASLLSWPIVTGDLGIFIRILLKCDLGFEVQVMSPLIFYSSQSVEVETCTV